MRPCGPSRDRREGERDGSGGGPVPRDMGDLHAPGSVSGPAPPPNLPRSSTSAPHRPSLLHPVRSARPDLPVPRCAAPALRLAGPIRSPTHHPGRPDPGEGTHVTRRPDVPPAARRHHVRLAMTAHGGQIAASDPVHVGVVVPDRAHGALPGHHQDPRAVQATQTVASHGTGRDTRAGRSPWTDGDPEGSTPRQRVDTGSPDRARPPGEATRSGRPDRIGPGESRPPTPSRPAPGRSIAPLPLPELPGPDSTPRTARSSGFAGSSSPPS